MLRVPIIRFGLALALVLSAPALAHVGSHPSIHDTVASIAQRLRGEMEPELLLGLDARRLNALLSPEERRILGEEHLVFDVNVPVRVSILRDTGLSEEPFWLQERGFTPSDLVVEQDALKFDVWQKDFPAGSVGLGVNSLQGGGEHYLVLVEPTNATATLRIENLYPGQLRLAAFEPGVSPYADRSETLNDVPADLRGQTLIRTLRDRRNDGRFVGLFRATSHPSTAHPDQIVLTWSGDPRTTQTIQWRSGPDIKRAVVTYQKRAWVHSPRPQGFLRVKGRTEGLEDPFLVNDPKVHRHTVELENLEPDTSYLYAVGDGSRDGWSELAEFTTAPARTEPFSFVYMGDAQNGLDRWGSLVHRAFRERPDAAFYLMAGDLVNRGNERDDWDSFFANAAGIFDRRTLVPVIGNHECQGGHPSLYLNQFTLPHNGPADQELERAYAFEYSNALFVVLDSNLEPEAQASWLEQQLANTDATWKFVTYHHPAYSSAPNRDNRDIRRWWTPLFDRYRVDLVLQGHDHAYLRTYPLHDQKPVKSPAEGTVYIVSVSGTKMYAQAERDYTAFGMTNVSTYQVLDIQISGNRLVYRAYDIDGNLRDDLIIEK